MPLGIDGLDPGLEDVRLRELLVKGQNTCHVVGSHDVVAAQEHHQVRRGHLDAALVVRSDAEVLLVADVSHLGVVQVLEVLRDPGIRVAVVDDGQVPARIGLAQDGLNRLIQVPGLAPERDHDFEHESPGH